MKKFNAFLGEKIIFSVKSCCNYLSTILYFEGYLMNLKI